MRPVFILALGLLLGSLHPAYAGFQDQLVLSLGAGVGYPISTAQFSGGWGMGTHFSGGLGYVLDGGQKYTLSTTVDYTNCAQSKIDFDIQREDRSLKVVSIFSDLKVHLRQRDVVINPYIKGGLGVVRLKTVNNLRALSDTQNQIGFELNAGVDITLTKHGGLFVDAQYQLGLGSGKTSQNIPFKVGLYIK